MKRIIIFAALAAVALAAASFDADAQYRSFTLDNPSIYKLVQIDAYDESTVFYFTAEPTKEDLNLCINDQAQITIDGTYKKYPLQTVGHMPLTSENEYAHLDGPDTKLNFCLIFDKLPLDKPLNLIENDKKEGPMMLNFRNIVVDTTAVSEKLDMVDFLNYTDYVVKGNYSKDGRKYVYYKRDGYCVAVHLRQELLELTKVANLFIEMTNDSGKPVSLSPDNIKVYAKKNEKKDYELLPLWGANDYDYKLSADQSMQASSYRDRINPIATSVSDYRKYRTDRSDVGSQVALVALESILRSTDKNKMEEYNAQLNAERSRRWDSYLQGDVLEDGEMYGGFVAFKDKNYLLYRIVINVGGREFPFLIKGK